MAGEQNVCEARGVTAYGRWWPPSAGVGYVDSSPTENSFLLCSETTYGVEIGTVNDTSADADNFCGAKVGIINETHYGDLNAAHVGLVNSASRDMNGVHVGIIYNNAGRDMNGVQAGIVNAGRNLDGFQLAIVNDAEGKMRGFQVAISNGAGDMDDFQIGVLNIADGNMHGVKLALVNIASGEMTGVPIGVLNFSGECRWYVATPIVGAWCLFGRKTEKPVKSAIEGSSNPPNIYGKPLR